MKFLPTDLPGAWIIDLEPRTDERGFFARAYCQNEFTVHGIDASFVQSNVAYSKRKGTLRGLHWQEAPFAEGKLVRCTRGAVFDVGVDLRPGSPTFRRHVAVELNEENHRMVYLPEGFAHGYLTLSDAAEVTYMVTKPYHPASARGARWNDPALAVPWPFEPVEILPRDQEYPDLPR